MQTVVSNESRAATCKPFLWLLPAALAVVWRSPIAGSYWLDETITDWITSGTWREAWDRSLAFQNGSTLYYLLIRGIKAVAGSDELTLRMPSLIAGALACLLVYQLAARLFGRASGVFAVLLLAANDEVLKAAFSARPYALALMLALASVLFFLQWLESRKLRHRLAYAAALVLCGYLHFMFAGIAVVHLALWWSRGADRPKARDLLLTWIGCLCAWLPAVPQLIDVFSRRAALFFGPPRPWQGLAQALFPPAIMIYVVCAAALAAAVPGFAVSVKAFANRRRLGALLIWWALAPLLCAAFAAMTGTPFFVPRYFLWQTPAIALIGAGLLGGIAPARARLAALAVIALLVLSREAARQWHVEDWRAAARIINSLQQGRDLPVLAYSGLIELERPDWIADPRRRPYLLAPFETYPLKTLPHPLPAAPEAVGMRAYVDRLRRDVIDPAPEMILAALQIRVPGSDEPAPKHLCTYFEGLGYAVQELPGAGLVKIFRLQTKTAPAASH